MTVRELAARAVTVRVGGRTLLEEYDFVTVAGELLGLSGASGSGKTTFLRVLAGLIEADSGDVRVDDETVRSHDGRRLALDMPIPALVDERRSRREAAYS